MGIPHRGISINNIMTSVDPNTECGAKRFLIDLEHAGFLQGKRTLCERTVRLLYIHRGESLILSARERLISWHDIESFSSSSLFVTLRHQKTNKGARYCSSVFELSVKARFSHG
ncbi:hypothetical protein OE88DRAFT_1656266 [Heliocybe sulcata]|uniref:Protein kinase domain-containing protein n=1 Tax=Heliocybe sulcata TaxID=5364 RepID=A0A5C3N6Q1_9AGAM|nr:hypothetical protein OE88DRAFT_1656266 [Heliocybe sulcata]